MTPILCDFVYEIPTDYGRIVDIGSGRIFPSRIYMSALGMGQAS